MSPSDDLDLTRVVEPGAPASTNTQYHEIHSLDAGSLVLYQTTTNCDSNDLGWATTKRNLGLIISRITII